MSAVHKEAVLSLLIPSRKRAFAYTALSLCFLLLNSEFVIADLLELQRSSQDVLPLVADHIRHFAGVLSRQSTAPLAVVVIWWGIVGLGVYFLLWPFVNLLASLWNRLVIEKTYIRPNPREAHRGLYWELATIFLHVLSIGLFFVYLIIWLQLVLPATGHSFREFMRNPTLYGQWAVASLTVFGLALSLHFLMVIVRILFDNSTPDPNIHR